MQAKPLETDTQKIVWRRYVHKPGEKDPELGRVPTAAEMGISPKELAAMHQRKRERMAASIRKH